MNIDREGSLPDMNLVEYENDDEMKVWLSESEVGQLLDEFEDTEKRIAVGLAVRPPLGRGRPGRA
ncbi:hypothetical protein GCM10009000_013910 [Halobacterium noricense]|uniref:Uncharacterized protein n=2 Tax=Haladaptatus pallidirubidus TaxID=1008152 RepID=A0AAV3UB04_9EURY